MKDDPYKKYNYTEEDLATASYIGLPLYVSLRNRLCGTLGLPTTTINTILLEAIMVYDESVLTTGDESISTITIRTKGDHFMIYIGVGEKIYP